jgi:hypothetical protein
VELEQLVELNSMAPEMLSVKVNLLATRLESELEYLNDLVMVLATEQFLVV